MAATAPAVPTEAAPPSFEQPRSRARRELLIFSSLALATSVGLVFLAFLLVDIFVAGISGLDEEFLTSFPSRLDPESTGIRASLTGTMSLMLWVAVGSFPLGVGAAVYLEEFAPQNGFTRLVETNISNLAGVPSVVYGLLGAGLFVGIMGDLPVVGADETTPLIGGIMDRTLFAGASTLILLILPVVIVTSREAIRAVPNALREGGMGLGATKWQTTWKLVLPQALPGMITGAILGLSRAIGEAAPILVVGAVSSSFVATNPLRLSEPFAALPIDIFSFTFDFSPVLQRKAASAIIVLLAVLLLMNGVAIYFRNRARRNSA